MTVEARPDSTQPVQGSLGLKQRVVLITPPKDPTETPSNGTKNAMVATTAPNQISTNRNTGCGSTTTGNYGEEKANVDALSAISSFNFKITPDDDWAFNPVLIQTAFITGEAAKQLNTCEAADAAQAITVTGVKNPGVNRSVMKNVVDSLKIRGSEQDKKQLDLLNGLAKEAIPEHYPVPIFRIDSTATILSIQVREGSSSMVTDIDSALAYWEQLVVSARTLKYVIDTPEKYQFGDLPASNDVVIADLRNTFEKTEQELRRVSQDLAGSPIYTDAIQYYVDKFIKNAQGE